MARAAVLTSARILAGAMLAAAVACSGGSPSAPSPTPTPPATFTTSVVVGDAITGGPLAGVAASGTDVGGNASAADGRMVVGSPITQSAPRAVTFLRSGYVDRLVGLRVPGNPATVSMIPSSFDLDAFDEFLRVVRLQRWTTAPPLRVQARVLRFTSVSAATAEAIEPVMTEAELAGLEADLTWALPRMTGETFQAFAGVTRLTAGPGEPVQVLNSGMISVAHFSGLTAATGFWGYSRWQFQPDGTVIAGTIMLDEDFDRSGSPYRRSLRAHELGHALGYTHVTRLTSVMNSNARSEPTTFDLQTARIAFQRPPGNIRPDADPSGASLNRVGGAVWSRGEGAGGRF